MRRIRAAGAALALLPPLRLLAAGVVVALGAAACGKSPLGAYGPFTSVPAPLETGGGAASHAAFAPTGSRIAFIRRDASNLFDLERVDRSSGATTLLLAGANTGGDLAAEPAGGLALTVSRALEEGQIWRLPLDGGGAPLLFPLDPPRPAAFESLDLDAAGRLLALERTTGANLDLVLLDLAGREVRRLPSGLVAGRAVLDPARERAALAGIFAAPPPSGAAEVHFEPLGPGEKADTLAVTELAAIDDLAFDRGGARLALAGRDAAGAGRLLVLDLGSGMVDAVPAPGAASPRFSPAGDSLAVLTGRRDSTEVAVVPLPLADQPAARTRGGGARAALAWLEDGRLLATHRPAARTDVWTVDADNGGLAQETASGDYVPARPAWDPAGRRIAAIARAGGRWEVRLVQVGSGSVTSLFALDRELLALDWGANRIAVAAAGAEGAGTAFHRLDPETGGEDPPPTLPLAGLFSIRWAGSDLLLTAAAELEGGAEPRLLRVDLAAGRVTPIAVLAGRLPQHVDRGANGLLAFSSVFEDGIYLFGRIADGAVRVGPRRGGRPSFAPDGRALVYDDGGVLFTLAVVGSLE